MTISSIRKGSTFIISTESHFIILVLGIISTGIRYSNYVSLLVANFANVSVLVLSLWVSSVVLCTPLRRSGRKNERVGRRVGYLRVLRCQSVPVCRVCETLSSHKFRLDYLEDAHGMDGNGCIALG